MIYFTAYTLLVVGLAGQTLAEPVREPGLARMSTRAIFGLQRRVIEGYSPAEQLCGDGDTCAEACGRGFRQCASDDGLTHCYNRSKKQTCCPGGSGDSCDNGYFCSADGDGQTWCCPEGLSLGACARKYDIPGPLTSQEPSTTTTATSSSSSSKTTSTRTRKTKTTTTAKSSSTESTDASNTSTAEASATTTTEPTITKSRTKSRKPESTYTSKTVHRTTTSTSTPEETSTTTASTSATTLLIDVSSVLGSIGAADTQTTPESALSPAPSATATVSPTGSVGTSGGNRQEAANTLLLFIFGAIAALV